MTSADGVHFSGTSLMSTLLKDDPNSLRGMVLAQAAPGHWSTWGRFPDAVRSGERQIKAAHWEADTIFDYFAAHRDEASHFTEAMSNLSAAAAIEIAKVIDTQDVDYALDVGGANGEVLRAMMRANPDLRGVCSTCRTSCQTPSIAAPASTNFGKLWALANLLILVPVFYLKFLDRIRRLWCRNFK